MEALLLELLKIGLVPGCFLFLLVLMLKDKEHLRIRLEKREDDLLVAYKDNVAASARLSQAIDSCPLKESAHGN